MRTITITIKDVNNGENASIDVQHSNNWVRSDMEQAVVELLDSYLYEKVCELTDSDGQLNIPKQQTQNHGKAN